MKKKKEGWLVEAGQKVRALLQEQAETEKTLALAIASFSLALLSLLSI